MWRAERLLFSRTRRRDRLGGGRYGESLPGACSAGDGRTRSPPGENRLENAAVRQPLECRPLSLRPGAPRRPVAVASFLLAAVGVPLALGALPGVAGNEASGAVAGAAGEAGVTIDRGAYAVDSTSVRLGLVWPSGANSALVSNDPTFDDKGGTVALSRRASMAWTLSPAGPSPASGTSGAGEERTVYVRFVGGAQPVTASAQVVLDRSTPAISDAEVLRAGRPPEGGARYRYRVRVVGTDEVSGISAVQTSAAPHGGDVTRVRASGRKGFTSLDEVVAPPSRSVPRYARLESEAGRWSRWLRVTPQLAVEARPGGGRLVAGADGTPYSLRGFDYQPLESVKVDGKTHYLNDLFSASHYRSAETARTLEEMASLGYDAVRVFVNVNEIGDPSAPGLDPAYVANLADLVATAQRDGIRVLLVTGQLPASGGYLPKNDPRFGTWNRYFLDPADLRAMQRYLSDLVTDLRSSGAPLSDVLFELVGEQDWKNGAAPLSWRSGRVRTADGRTYDMASATSRAAMENGNLLHWTNTLSAELHRLVPGSLVGLGFYAPSINEKRHTWTVRPGVVFGRAARNDFVDVHAYSNLGSLEQQIDSFGAASTEKVVVLGEFGAARSSYPTPLAAARGVIRWERLSCRLSAPAVSGWLEWTWNSGAQREYWTALDGGGKIEHALSPRARPDPCS